MKVQIINQISKAILVSGIKADQFEAVKAYKPATFTIKDAEGNETFRVMYNQGGRPSVETFGITFNGKNTAGFLTVELPIPADVEDKATWIKENHFQTLINLKVIEGQILETLDEAMELKESISDIFTILD